MKRALLITLAAALASAVVITAALAEGSWSDPAGDAGDAPDITGVQVSNDNGGTILFSVAVSNLTPESQLFLALDTDKNSTTGDDGMEYGLEWGASATASDNGWFIEKWDGTTWVHPDHPTMKGMKTAAGVEFSINKSDLGGTSGFAFKVMTARYVADAITGTDMAPDGLGTWTYDVTPAPPPTPAPTPKPVVVKPVFGRILTSFPVAGKRVKYTIQVKRSDTGAPLRTGKMVCDPSVAGKVLPHTEQFKNGVASLTFVIPKTAKGKTLKVKVRIVVGKQSALKVTTLPILVNAHSRRRIGGRLADGPSAPGRQPSFCPEPAAGLWHDRERAGGGNRTLVISLEDRGTPPTRSV